MHAIDPLFSFEGAGRSGSERKSELEDRATDERFFSDPVSLSSDLCKTGL